MSGHLVACHECDLLQRLPEVPPGAQARCGRCGYVLARPKTDSIERTIALLVAGVFLFVIFNAFPFLAFKKEGLVQQSHIVNWAYLGFKSYGVFSGCSYWAGFKSFQSQLT